MASPGTTPCADDEVWVCCACGRTSPTKYGFDASGKTVANHWGYNENCAMNSVLVKKSACKFGDGGYVVHVSEIVRR